MEKVKLTQEQAEAIDIAIKRYGKDAIINNLTSGGVWTEKELKPLQRMLPSTLVRALYVGYEVVSGKDVE